MKDWKIRRGISVKQKTGREGESRVSICEKKNGNGERRGTECENETVMEQDECRVQKVKKKHKEK